MDINIARFFQTKKNVRIIVFIYDYCNSTKRRRPHVRYYRRLARLIEDFEENIHKELYTDSFDDKTTEDFLYFIKNFEIQRKGRFLHYRQSTIKQFKEKLISILNKASRCGYLAKLDSLKEMPIPDEDVGAVYLSEDEIEKILDLKLSGSASQVRDLFVLGCCTALRYSDYNGLTKDNFLDNGTISVLTKKTNERVIIPLHRFVNRIIERNKGYGFLRYPKSSQSFNLTIKSICKKAKINDNVLIERTEGFVQVKKKYKKWELVSSHTARRSGATNMYLAGIPPFRIMLLTGHKTESAFYRYIRIRKEENAKELQNHAFFS